MDIFTPLMSIIENYGWYMLLFGVVFVYLYQNLLKSYVDQYLKRRAEEEYAAKYHKNPDLFVARQVAQQEAAMRLQEKYKKEAEEYQKKMEEREAKKRNEIVENFMKESDGGRKLGSGSSSLRSDYNPLTGGSGGSTYRPPRRSPCSGGGCG